MRNGACAGPVGRHQIWDAALQIAQLHRDNRGCDRPNQGAQHHQPRRPAGERQIPPVS